MEEVTEINVEVFDPTLEKKEAGMIIIGSCLVLAFGFSIQRSVLQLLKRKYDRAINCIIFYQQVSLVELSQERFADFC